MYVYIYIVPPRYSTCRVPRFVQLMKHAARRRQAPGHVMVKGGVPFPKATATGRTGRGKSIVEIWDIPSKKW